jgi:predicted transcriptional regulator
MEIDKIALICLGLGHALRFRVFNLIACSGELGIRPQEIREKIEIPQATLSFHLKQLLISDLIWLERKGTRLFYHCNTETVSALGSELKRIMDTTDSQNNAIITKPRIKVKPHISIEILKELNK